MNVIEINLPKNLDLSNFEIKMSLASKLYEQGRLSSGECAEMTGISKRAFIELLGHYNVSLFGYNTTELLEDISNA